MILDFPIPAPASKAVCEVCMSFATLDAFKFNAQMYGYWMLVVGVIIGFVLPKVGAYCHTRLVNRKG
jgi:hypothetical protein